MWIATWYKKEELCDKCNRKHVIAETCNTFIIEELLKEWKPAQMLYCSECRSAKVHINNNTCYVCESRNWVTLKHALNLQNRKK